MKTLTHDQIESVICWLNSFDSLKETDIPVRFKEDFTKQLNLTNFKITELPKISLNDWYSSKHWTYRFSMKKKYSWIVKRQFKRVFKKHHKYKVSYGFYFKKRPLDASNTVSMLKMIEDIIFENDKYDIVTDLHIYSRKSKEDYVLIKVEQY